MLGGVVVAWITRWWLQYRKIGQMYSFLKAQVKSSLNQTINITHTIPELEARFGRIDEQIWEKVNDLRASEGQIGFYEDDFLYWKQSI